MHCASPCGSLASHMPKAGSGAPQGVLLDQFGVLHDGREPYPGAAQAVQQLHAAGLRILILSNSSRRSGGTLQKLAKMGFQEEWFAGGWGWGWGGWGWRWGWGAQPRCGRLPAAQPKGVPPSSVPFPAAGVITSGEVTHQRLLQRPGPFWQGLGRRCLHITWGTRGAISLDGLGLEVGVHTARGRSPWRRPAPGPAAAHLRPTLATPAPAAPSGCSCARRRAGAGCQRRAALLTRRPPLAPGGGAPRGG
jgi:hypothetical protein